ncbi:MAG TPA: glycosyltransferase [Candidatus Saccharimonadales bacterium]
MKRILVIASTFPASDNDPVPAFVKDQIIALKQLKPEFEFTVLAPHDKRSNTESFTKQDAYNEYRFHYFWPFSVEKLAGRGIMPALKASPLNYFIVPFLFIGEFMALLRVTIKLKPDILYAHWFTPQAVVARWVGALTATPFVFTTHALDVNVWHKIPIIGTLVVRGAARKAQAFTAVSMRSMARLEQFFPPGEWSTLKKRGTVIPMGVNLPSQDVYKHPKGQTILFMGRLAEKKGVQYLIKAFGEIIEKYPEAKLVIAGDGPLKKDLQKQARNIENVDFTGFISGEKKHLLLRSSKLYVVPSIIASDGDVEGLPVSLMEGLAYGKVCIATNESGADDILTNRKDGFLVPQKDVSALAEALERGLALSKSDYGTVSREARRTAAQFAWPHVAKQHNDFLFRHRP